MYSGAIHLDSGKTVEDVHDGQPPLNMFSKIVLQFMQSHAEASFGYLISIFIDEPPIITTHAGD